MSKIYLKGRAGKIECMFHKSENPKSPIALVLHPNPLYGGTMNNKIVYHLAKSFVNSNFSVLRFNFRGVGGSAGVFDAGSGELEDVNTVLDWLRENNPFSSHYWIAGFSFGAYIAMKALVRRPEIEHFILASPSVTKYNCDFFQPCPISGLVLNGTEDKITKSKDIENFILKCNKGRGVHVSHESIEGANHFFQYGHLNHLDEVVEKYITSTLNIKTVKPIFKSRKKLKASY